ncbi:universal stress protein [Nocardioides sp. zg-1308]|uniref:Universal stress protein n=1 Tax=Nocardioides renjunii TaxID=3095075 RepID=A0ABU5K7K7_9ACTN|nr:MULTISPECIES: universal stress protein [unclassified Nocardioides]MDZ5660951.1 universal stress protein [Nocardioides sp. S-58]NPD04072.1 universal stress protein [Nocardioides sp. zg-1308]WQQ21947.1 universal stress protein [Nocardioides sp. S-34]
MTIVIGYVPSAVGEAALEAGLAEAAAHGEDVVILNSPRRRSTVDVELIDETAADELVARAEQAGVTARVDHADHGDDLVETFRALVAATSARLVVIGLRRRSPVGKLVTGSDAQRLLLDLDVPILAVKPAS